MSNRKPNIKAVPKEDWTGERVAYKPTPNGKDEFGTVTRMATGKSLCMFVLFDGETQPKLCYAFNLRKL